MHSPRPATTPATPACDAVRGFAFVRQNFRLDLQAGRNSVRVSDVAALIEPTTVTFESLTAPTTTRVLEQNFQFDLVGRERCSNATSTRTSPSRSRTATSQLVSGKLLSTAGGIILRSDNGTVGVFNNVESLQLPRSPTACSPSPRCSGRSTPSSPAPTTPASPTRPAA